MTVHEFFSSPWSVGSLVRFHAAHKLLLMAHSPAAYRQLGRLVAQAAGIPRDEVRRQYTAMFLAAIALEPSRGRHVNVLQHITGCLRDRVDAPSRAAIAAAIDAYRQSLVPLSVPLAMIRFHVRQHGLRYMSEQVYLRPSQ